MTHRVIASWIMPWLSTICHGESKAPPAARPQNVLSEGPGRAPEAPGASGGTALAAELEAGRDACAMRYDGRDFWLCKNREHHVSSLCTRRAGLKRSCKGRDAASGGLGGWAHLVPDRSGWARSLRYFTWVFYFTQTQQGP